MNTNELRKAMRKAFPSLKKPLFSENIFCFDADFHAPEYDEIKRVNDNAWAQVEARGLVYVEMVSDCDDFASVMLGRVKEQIMKMARDSGGGLRPWPFCELSGISSGVPHSFNGFICDRGVFVSDYGQIKTNLSQYKPIWARF